MTDLTEQWDKGELPEGDYYIKRRNGLLLYDNIDSRGVWRNSIDEDIIEVLAQVPTFEEWQALLSDQLAKNEGVEINAELEAENERLKTFLKKAINLVMESNWENHAHYKESIQLRDETNNLLNDSPSPTDLKQG